MIGVLFFSSCKKVKVNKNVMTFIHKYSSWNILQNGMEVMVPNSGCENPELVGNCQLQTLQQVTGIRSDMECLVILDQGWVFITLNVMGSVWCSQYSTPAAHEERIWFPILLPQSFRKSCKTAAVIIFFTMLHVQLQTCSAWRCSLHKVSSTSEQTKLFSYSWI